MYVFLHNSDVSVQLVCDTKGPGVLGRLLHNMCHSSSVKLQLQSVPNQISWSPCKVIANPLTVNGMVCSRLSVLGLL